jgi:DNA polymerase-3 subunit alpha
MLIKFDLLSVEAEDKIHTCLDLLAEQNYIEPEATLRETYEKYLGIYNLERNAPDMWKMVWRHDIQALFQMEKQSGIQGIALTKPESVDDLAVLNSVIRLMAQSKDDEQPLNKYARFKRNINLWYDEMRRYGLTDAEQEILKPIVGLAYGICESQEKFMQLVQLPECGGFDLTWADRLRKAIAKKNPAEYDNLTNEYFEKVRKDKLSYNLCNYVWNVLVATSRGYGFNASHTLAYSLVALQEMNLAYRFPIIFWNCACLISDTGGDENDVDEEDEKKKTKSTNYNKIAAGIGKMRGAGINVAPPDINNSSYTFRPDTKNNCIYYGLSGILNVGEEVINDTIAKRPYVSPKDYYLRVKPNKSAMISLIKGGAFDNLMDRKLCMAWFIWETCDKKNNLTLQNMPGLIRNGLIPQEDDKQIMALRVYEFNRYLKSVCKYNAEDYKLDERAINFLFELERGDLVLENKLLNIKTWDKCYQTWMNVFRSWILTNKEQILQELNDLIFKADWEKYATGNYSSWEMEALCFYYHDHELINLNREKYGIKNFFNLPEEPEVDRSFVKGGRTINLFKLCKICGTCIAKNKDKGLVTLLTPDGVVEVKFRHEVFAFYDRQISEKQIDGSKKVIEKSWFSRGSHLLIQGIRSGDNFIVKKYANQGLAHTVMKINKIFSNGDFVLQTERALDRNE